MSGRQSVLVIGAQGVLGSTAVRAFEQAGWDVRRGGRRPNGHPNFRLVDLDRPETVAGAVREVEAVVNTVPDPDLRAERMVLEQGGTIVNVSALPAAPGQQLRADTADARGLVVLNAGMAPGTTNLVVADLLAAQPEADAIEIAITISTSGISGRAGGEFAHRHLTTTRRHRTARIPFPPPLGERCCVEFAEPEGGWLGDLGAGRSVSSYVCFVERPVHRTLLALNRLGLMSVLPNTPFVAGRGRIPDEPSREPIAHWVGVLRNGVRLAASTVECEGDYRSTAAVSVLLADALLESPRAEPNRTGCFDPAALFTIGQLEPRLREAGIRIVPQDMASARE